MGSKSAKRASSALDAAMAALAAGAVAFVVYAMPQGSFESLVASSGLPQVLPAAEPPLGMTARIGALCAAGAATFALVWLVLRALGPKAPPPRRKGRPTEIELTPKIRRADAHPDAPARRPIFAALDFGEPEPAAEEAEFADLAEPAATEVVEEEAPARPEPLAAVAAALPEPPEVEQTSIAHLMQRLELGLLRRERSGDPAELRAANEPAEMDERLRSAIEDLQQLARRA